MAYKYFKTTIGTRLDSTFKIVYDLTSSLLNFTNTASIYDRSANTYSPAVNVTYDELTEEGAAIVRTDNGISQLKIEDENDYCSDCTSNVFQTAPVSNPVFRISQINHPNFFTLGFGSNGIIDTQGGDGSSDPISASTTLAAGEERGISYEALTTVTSWTVNYNRSQTYLTEVDMIISSNGTLGTIQGNNQLNGTNTYSNAPFAVSAGQYIIFVVRNNHPTASLTFNLTNFYKLS